jgi:hypothetical protein
MFDEPKHRTRVINRNKHVTKNDLCINLRCLILYLARIIIAATHVDSVIRVEDIVSSDRMEEIAVNLCIGSMNVSDIQVRRVKQAIEIGHAKLIDWSRSRESKGKINISIY